MSKRASYQSHSRAAGRRSRSATALIAAAGLAAARAVDAPAGAIADTGGAPRAVSTLGGRGHAEMYPSGMEISPDGTVVIADTGNDQVAKYSASGTQMWRIGTSGKGFNQFSDPRDVGIDSAGNSYIADDANSRVVKLSPTGAWLTTWKGPAGDRMGPPIGLSVKNDLVYVADANKRKVRVYDTSGNQLRAFGQTGACTFAAFRDVDADSAGNVFIANYTNDTILEMSADGTQCLNTWGSKGSGNGQFLNPYGIRVAVDPVLGAEAVYVADSNNERIQEFTHAGAFVAAFGSKGTGNGQFLELRRVAVATDGSGDVWGSDLWGYRVERFHRTATGYTFAQSIPNPVVPPPLTDTQTFNEVRGIGFDTAGDVFAADTVNQRFVEFDTTGHVLGACGQRGFSSIGGFNWPRGVAVDQQTGNIWVADTKQSDIQILRPPTAGCTGVAKFGKLGTGLTNLNWPHSIAIRQSDHIAWVADTLNNRIVSYSVATHAPIASFSGFNAPRGIAVSPTTGHVFVADMNNNRVVELSDTAGNSITQVRVLTDGFVGPQGVAVDSTGRISVADSGNSRVVVLNPDDTELGTITTGLSHIENVASGPGDKLYVADTYNDRILVYSY